MIDEKTIWFTYNVINDCDVIDSHLGDDTIGVTSNSIIAYIVEKYGIETEVIIANHEVEGCLVYLGSCSLGRIYTTIPTTRYTTLEYHLSRHEHNMMVTYYHGGDWRRVMTYCMSLSSCFGGVLHQYYQVLKQSIVISK